MKSNVPMFSMLSMMSVAAALFVGAAVFGGGLAQDEKRPDAKPKSLTLNVYALDTCPVTGKKLGSMGDPVVKEYEDGSSKREVRFCCAGCVEPFEENKAERFEKIDKTLIERQKAHYPLKECIVSGRELEKSDTVQDVIHEGRLVRFCCPGCPTMYEKDPDKYMGKLDKAIIEQQREKYPLKTCVVAGSELGSMGEPAEVIVGGSLVRFCCKGCVGGFKKDPAKHLATIRAAWIKQHEEQQEGGH